MSTRGDRPKTRSELDAQNWRKAFAKEWSVDGWKGVYALLANFAGAFVLGLAMYDRKLDFSSGDVLLNRITHSFVLGIVYGGMALIPLSKLLDLKAMPFYYVDRDLVLHNSPILAILDFFLGRTRLAVTLLVLLGQTTGWFLVGAVFQTDEKPISDELQSASAAVAVRDYYAQFLIIGIPVIWLFVRRSGDYVRAVGYGVARTFGSFLFWPLAKGGINAMVHLGRVLAYNAGDSGDIFSDRGGVGPNAPKPDIGPLYYGAHFAWVVLTGVVVLAVGLLAIWIAGVFNTAYIEDGRMRYREMEKPADEESSGPMEANAGDVWERA